MQKQEQELTFKNLFLPLTAKKAMIFIVIIGLVVFFNMLFNGFVWDDDLYVIQGSAEIGSHLLRLFTGFSIFNTTGFYRPVAAIYYYILYNFFGLQPFFYHFLQITIHIINSILLFFLFRKLLTKNLSFVLAIIFLVHPMQVESVSYIASYGFLSFFFGISALILSSVQKLNKNFIPIVILLLILSILTKETGIVFLALIPTLKFLTKRNSVITYSIISSAIFCAYLILRFFIVGLFSNSMISVPISLLSLPMRLLNIPAILFYYLKTFLFPLNLAISQMWTISSINLNNFYLPLFLDLLLFFIFILLGFICYKHKKTFPTFLFFGVWFILGISLYLQVIPLDMTVSEQWFYLPMAGLLGLIGIAWQVIFSKYIKTNIALAFLIIISILLSFRTMARIPEWQNPIKLYSHDVNVIDSYNTESLLGNEYWYQNKTAEALTHFKKSDELRPGYDYIASEIATSYERLGDLKNAKDYHLKSMSYKSYRTDVRHTYITYLNASRFFLYFDDPRITIKYSSQGVKEYPTEKYLWILLGLAENKLGNKPAAISALNKAYKAFPDPNVLYLASQISAGKQIEVPIQAFWPRDN